MTCYNPLTAFKNEGERKLTFKEYPHTVRQYQIPCQQCIGCKLDHSLGWAIRIMHEAKMHDDNCFVTLTYNDENLPQYGFLRKEDPVKFMKRLRKACSATSEPNQIHNVVHTQMEKAPRKAAQIPFYMCGEYGDLTHRPHYHYALFGLDFSDKVYLKTTAQGHKLYYSPLLQKLWPFGNNIVAELTIQSAAYIARYVTKKLTGDGNRTHYEIINPDTGEILLKPKEYATMSRAQGIGKSYLEKYKQDWYPEGKLVIKGHKVNTPRYYDKKMEEQFPDMIETLKFGRELEAKAHYQNNTVARLRVRQQVHQAQAKQLKRPV